MVGNHNNKAESLDNNSVAIAENYNKEKQVIDNSNRETGDRNILEITDQNNNNNSVQLNGSSQGGASYGIVSNSSLSANNTGMNVMSVGDIKNTNPKRYDMSIYQANNQTAKNFNNTATANGFAMAVNDEYGATQDVNNMNEFTDIITQNNNNNSVQLNGESQRSINALIVQNSANSATNIAVNGIYSGSIADVTVTQNNTQSAESHVNYADPDSITPSQDYIKLAAAGNMNKETQVIRNFTVEDPDRLAYMESQNNNNNSVQLNNSAQSYSQTAVLINNSLSASNAGLNLLATGDITDTNATYANVDVVIVSQSNNQTAKNETYLKNCVINPKIFQVQI